MYRLYAQVKQTFLKKFIHQFFPFCSRMMGENERTPLLKGADDEKELSGCGGTICCNPWRPVHRYLVLIIMCFLSFGSYFCYDNPAAMQDTMKSDLNIDTQTFMGFYSFYSWPNVILCFFGGFLIDRVFGVRLGAIIFSLFVTVGQGIFALGAFVDKVWLMDMGRFIFGIGGESLCVAQNTYAVSWFKGRELNMVFGLQLSFSRVGSTVNMNVMPTLYRFMAQFYQGYTCLGVVLLIAGCTCVMSLFCALALAYFDKRLNRILKKDEEKTGEVIHMTDIKDFSIAVWLCCLICVAYYVAIFPFIGLGLVFFEQKFDMEPADANAVNSIVYIISAVASPFFGFVIDKTGKNVFWVIAGVLVTIACHGTLAFTFINPYVAMSVMGLAYSVLASALWPMVALVVPEHQLGTAYGIMQSIQNLGLAVISIVAGLIVDSKGYLFLEVFFLAWLCLALIGAVLLYVTDATRGGRLNMSAGTRRNIEELQEDKSVQNEKQ
ncbi:major facilitator superfamily domain-containing protein 1-like isoform X2 [Lineus longissimus]|uniref:major facilitator superfamily domain-containing protein 1-like isoform X2 n=1 Tax=Lineus longissimus TaxID=88925 RepID=UPI002B4E0758